VAGKGGQYPHWKRLVMERPVVGAPVGRKELEALDSGSRVRPDWLISE
jgi:hypothetical protein